MTLNQLMVKAPVHTVNQHQLQDLERTQEDKDYKDPHSSYKGIQVPSYNPDLSRDKLPLKTSHPYATCSKGEPPTLSLSTTAGVGSGGLRKAQTQSVMFCSKCLGKPFWILAIQSQSPKPTLGQLILCTIL